MARSCMWRRTCTDAASWHQDEALNTTIYIVRQNGPTGFILKEEAEEKLQKVFLGDPHHCSCTTFSKEKDICKHICWLLLKKFRLSRDDPISWQLGLVEREIGELLRGRNNSHVTPVKSKPIVLATDDDSSKPSLKQRQIESEDICPICQDELLRQRLPVTFCRYGCGNNIHIKCMKIWAEHQIKGGADANCIKCPMCREEFGPFSLIQAQFKNANSQIIIGKQTEHLGTVCRNCKMCPIVGQCYRCSVCHDFYLCESCFNASLHQHHSFDVREKQMQRWKPVANTYSESSAHLLPSRAATRYAHSEGTGDDSDLSYQPVATMVGKSRGLTLETVKSFPLQHVTTQSRLLAPGVQCQVCLQAFTIGQTVRHLPCKHKFHQHCIDDWLLHRHPTCPVDGITYSNETVTQMHQANLAKRNQERDQRIAKMGGIGEAHTEQVSLCLPGIGIALCAPANGRGGGMYANGAINGRAAHAIEHLNVTGQQLQQAVASEIPDSFTAATFMRDTAKANSAKHINLKFGDTDNAHTLTAKTGSNILSKTRKFQSRNFSFEHAMPISIPYRCPTHTMIDIQGTHLVPNTASLRSKPSSSQN